jgi:hypothetical protein
MWNLYSLFGVCLHHERRWWHYLGCLPVTSQIVGLMRVIPALILLVPSLVFSMFVKSPNNISPLGWCIANLFVGVCGILWFPYVIMFGFTGFCDSGALCASFVLTNIIKTIYSVKTGDMRDRHEAWYNFRPSELGYRIRWGTKIYNIFSLTNILKRQDDIITLLLRLPFLCFLAGVIKIMVGIVSLPVACFMTTSNNDRYNNDNNIKDNSNKDNKDNNNKDNSNSITVITPLLWCYWNVVIGLLGCLLIVTPWMFIFDSHHPSTLILKNKLNVFNMDWVFRYRYDPAFSDDNNISFV